MQQFGKNQLAILIIVFLIGSTPLFELGIEAKQDAWLAMAMAAVVGLLLTIIYVTIQMRSPKSDIAELYKIHFGKYIGAAIALIHAVWFSYESMRNVRDVGELTSMALLSTTPKWVIMLLILFVAAYTVNKGIEVFVRVVQLLFPIVFISYTVIILLLFFGGLVNVKELMPIMENGPIPIVKAAFPDLLSFPFGQMVVLLVFWNHVKEKKLIGKVTYLSLTGVSIFLVFMNAIILCVLGKELAGLTALPLLHVVQLIRLANFLERLDIIVTLLLFIGLFVKIVTLYMASVFTLSAVTRISQRYFVLPVGVIIYAASFLEPNNTYHIWIGLDITLKIVPFFQIVLPLLMFAIGVRKRYRVSGNGAKGQEA
ncbi:GerAB/ArcD/ProY family transporter [Paenibacillus sp. GSMTC-2017]|uniref:GerAB/ArcD/ProY family transporter n=1 Tax=Paenibacillus sp. GSMTC-2017 TaxID=2794350 RepID=UPI0018D8943B|nr:GerAB/ArcD/ProY family transporter [Paenibacillus sp. GSMTC-2017]MBH5316732.1 GerAB/ArcD/ProY family transporter [Paenibacillus sp. GSMTC-2017]